MRSPEDYVDIYASVAAWARDPKQIWQRGETYEDYLYPLIIPWDPGGYQWGRYNISKEELDPLVPDLKDFWANTGGWLNEKWGWLATWFSDLNTWIESLWNSILAGLFDLGTAVKDEIVGLANFVSNIYTWVVWNLVDDVTTFVSNLFKPITDAWSIIYQTVEYWLGYIYNAITGNIATHLGWIEDMIANFETWLGSIKDAIWDSLVWVADIVGAYLGSKLADFAGILTPWFDTIRAAIADFLETPRQWVIDMAGDLWTWLGSIKDAIWDSLIEAADIVGGYIGTKLTEFAPLVVEYLRDALLWLWDNIKSVFVFVVEDVVVAAYEATSGALGALKDEFTNLIGTAYDEMMEKATALVPITPERSAGIAAGMFGAAVGFGALAHGMALAVEAVPNLKYMGTHYLSAFVARMGSFGTISSATMGVIAALAIREPFGYYMKSILRPTQPREMDLQIMAVKPDITLETFRQGMKYQGYSDFWIDAFERTMYHEPSYFEMSMLGEDEAATPEWLFNKSRRSGYTEEDAHVFVSSMIKKVTRDQRKEYYKQAFNAFKEGYISADQFKEHLDHLDIRPEAKDLATRAANMAYQTDLSKELVSTYRRSFQDDLITEAELRASLSALGMIAERVEAIIDLEWVRKEPKILKAERKEIETEWRDLQGEYSRVYVESFRKGIITEGNLVAFLVAIGVKERAAQATARYEAIKLVPKPKPLEIIIPALPLPPEPPVYED